MKFLDKLFNNKKELQTDVPKYIRPQRVFKNFPAANPNGWMLTKEQNKALLLVMDAIERNAHMGGGFTWDEIALGAMDTLMEYGYLDSLKNPSEENQTNTEPM